MPNFMKSFALSAVLWAIPLVASAGQSLGVYCWEQNPYKDVICFDLELKTGGALPVFALTGTAEAADTYTVAVYGSAVYDPSRSQVVLSFTQTYTSYSFQNEVILNTTNLNGTWADDSGNSGDFRFLGPPGVRGSASAAINRRDHSLRK